jgi:hypothetical protein
MARSVAFRDLRSAPRDGSEHVMTTRKVPSTAFQPGQSGNPATCFKPGQSGNPLGRPAVVKTLQALAREQAIQALVAALKHPSTRVSAATALLDRGYGRPIQTQHTRVIRSASDLTDEELAAIIAGGEAEEDLPLH